LGIGQYILLEAAKFGIKTFEICESSTEYLWHFIVYSGAGTEVTPGIVVPDQLKSSKIMVKLSEPLMNKNHKLWMGNYNSPSLCVVLRDNIVNVTGTLRLNRTHVPASVKNKKLKKGEAVAAECSGLMIMKWRDKRDVSFIPNFHDNTMVTKNVRGN
jgi:hypothetical protein